MEVFVQKTANSTENQLREKLEALYEESTGLSPRHGAERINVLMRHVQCPTQVAAIFDSVELMGAGRWWSQGEIRGDIVCLGYSSKRVGWKNAVFARIPHLEVTE